ncbi:hypothetical protein BOX15_Mlig025516g1 [Macrostomum lignano]|nr:hypothetical protein BOX15_Mlig025516g1 [Macrostomum lignano]
MAHCVWCDSKSAIMSRVSLCFNYYLSSLNTSGPVPPPPSLEDATVTDSDATDSADSTASAAGKPDGVAVVALLLVLYALLILLGLFSNLMVAVSLVKRREFANVTNMFVLGLSLSDILICGMLMPSLLVYDLTRRNYIAASLPRTFYCRVLLTSLSVPIYASCLIILWVAVDRYRLICHPHGRRMSRREAGGLLLLTVLLGLLVHSPAIVFNTVETRQTIGYCAERWPDKSLRLVYSIGAFCLQFCTPLIVTGALYFCIYRRLSGRIVQHKRETERKRRTNRILISIVISFAFFWSPWSVFNVVSEVEQYKKLNPQKVAAFIDCINVTKSWDVINANMRLLMEPDNSSIVHDSWNILELFVRLFALGSACVNPYLYGWLNEEIRASLKACLPRRCRSLLNSGGGRTDPDEERLKTLGEQSTSKCQQIPMTEEAVVAQQIDGEDPDDADQSRNGGSSTTAALIVHSQPGVTEST